MNEMKKISASRRLAAVQNEIRFRNSPLSFNIKIIESSQQRELLLAALMLYVAEGAKTGNTVDFTNSDPRLLKVFMKFLREICQVTPSKLRLYLYCFSDQNVDELMAFWAETLRVDTSCFTKPYVRKSATKGKRVMPWGVLHIRYNDKRLLEKILLMSSQFLHNLGR